jgi:hypothetical protein
MFIFTIIGIITVSLIVIVPILIKLDNYFGRFEEIDDNEGPSWVPWSY